MSLVKLANVCAHLQNCTRVSLPLAQVPFTRLHIQLSLGLYKAGFLKSVQKGSVAGPDLVPQQITPDNIATRRLWLGLKYKDSKSVLSRISLVSKPNRKAILTKEEIRSLSQGKKVQMIHPLQPGEVMFVRVSVTKDAPPEVIDLQEASDRHLGGEVLCRAS